MKAPFRPEAPDYLCECGGRRVLPSQLKPRTPLRRVSEKREAEEAAIGRPQRRSSLKQGNGFAASKAQRDKVRLMPCLACGHGDDGFGFEEETGVDPAHLWPRGKGGCDSPDCVIPLCRKCHRAFDQGELDLTARLAGSEAWAVEQAHPILEHGVSLLELLRRLSGNAYIQENEQLRARVAELEVHVHA